MATIEGLTKAIIAGKEYDRDAYIKRQMRIACRSNSHHPFSIEELVALDILSHKNLKVEKKQFVKLLEQKYKGRYYGKGGVKRESGEGKWRTSNSNGTHSGINIGDIIIDEKTEILEVE